MGFNIGDLTIPYYSLCLLAGIIVGYLLVLKYAKNYNVEEKHIDNLLFLSLPTAIVGARLYHVLAEWNYYKNNLHEIFSLQMSGFVIFGAIIGSLIVFWIYAKVKKFNIWELLDLGSLGLLAGQIVGRFGNFFNKELYGYPTDLPWGVFIPFEKRIVGYENYEYFHPTFFYESIWNVIGLVIILLLERHWVETHPTSPTCLLMRQGLRRTNCASLQYGKTFSFYLIWYGIGRLIIGFIRIEPKDLWIFNDGQILSIIFFVIGVVLLFRNKVKKK